MKKQLNVDQIQSELRGGSAFFPGYRGSASPTASAEQSPSTGEQPMTDRSVPSQEGRQAIDQVGVPPTVPRPVPRPGPLIPKAKRPIRQRQPFDIYEDQYVTLKKTAEAEKGFVNGRSMSLMVREAIDNYLKTHDSSKK
jgi:hypothetical protein